MKFVKILGLLAVASAALMAFAATASATIVTSPTGTPYTGTIHAHSQGHAVLENPIAKVECNSTVHGNSLTHGELVTAVGDITVTFTGCTNSWHVTVVTSGKLEVHTDEHPGAGKYDGTVTSNGATVETTRFGVTCRYSTKETSVGTITSGKTPTIHIDGQIPFHSGSGLCGTGTTRWVGAYELTTPDEIFID